MDEERRKFLQAFGITTAGGLAGCLSDDDDDRETEELIDETYVDSTDTGTDDGVQYGEDGTPISNPTPEETPPPAETTPGRSTRTKEHTGSGTKVCVTNTVEHRETTQKEAGGSNGKKQPTPTSTPTSTPTPTPTPAETPTKSDKKKPLYDMHVDTRTWDGEPEAVDQITVYTEGKKTYKALEEPRDECLTDYILENLESGTYFVQVADDYFGTKDREVQVNENNVDYENTVHVTFEVPRDGQSNPNCSP